MHLIVNISDGRVSRDPADRLATYSLGSCIAVAACDPVAGVAGLIHVQLPESVMDKARAAERPCMFADTGMEWLIDSMTKAGASARRMQITLAGAAQILDDNLFNIGRRNHAAVRKVLWKKGLFIAREDVGGDTPRNVYVNVADGAVSIKPCGLNAAERRKSCTA